MQAWDKQKLESNFIFSLFTLYRCRIEYRNTEELSKISGKPKAIISKWIEKYDWVSRAEEFDKFVQFHQSTNLDNHKVSELKGTIDKLQTALKDKINEQFEGIESAKIDDIIKLITNLNKLALDLEKTNNPNNENVNSFDEFIKKIRSNSKAMKAFYAFLKIVELG